MFVTLAQHQPNTGSAAHVCRGMWLSLLINKVKQESQKAEFRFHVVFNYTERNIIVALALIEKFAWANSKFTKIG